MAFGLPLAARDSRTAIRRFAAPESRAVLGLAWRRSSPRKRDDVEFGKLVLVSRELAGAAPA